MSEARLCPRCQNPTVLMSGRVLYQSKRHEESRWPYFFHVCWRCHLHRRGYTREWQQMGHRVGQAEQFFDDEREQR